MAWIQELVSRFLRSRIGRTITRYGDRRGELIAGGMSFAAVFSAFAALYVAFAVFGIVLSASPMLRDEVIGTVAELLPGLIDTGSGGAISVDALLSAGVLGWSGVIAVAVLTMTMLGWLASVRDGVRQIFGVPAPPSNPILLKVVDLGLAVGMGALILLSAVASLVSAAAVGWVAGLVGLDEDSLAVQATLQLLGLAIGYAVNVAIMLAIFRLIARIPLRPGPLWSTSLLGAAALSALTLLGSRLLGGAGSNPFLASFAVLVGLLLFFNLVSRVILFAAALASTGREPLVAGSFEAEYLDPKPARRRRWWRFWDRDEGRDARSRVVRGG